MLAPNGLSEAAPLAESERSGLHDLLYEANKMERDYLDFLYQELKSAHLQRQQLEGVSNFSACAECGCSVSSAVHDRDLKAVVERQAFASACIDKYLEASSASMPSFLRTVLQHRIPLALDVLHHQSRITVELWGANRSR